MSNWQATLAAVHARGPRCEGRLSEDCTGWTYLPMLLTLPSGIKRLCTECAVKSVRTSPHSVWITRKTAGRV
jgi:hypothetical protein